jgi:nucleoside-diphosphate-sugar epimerase
MRTAIIGGTGLIGAATTGLLSRHGIPVVVLSRRAPDFSLAASAQWLACDICDAAALGAAIARIRAESIIHLAAYLQFACEANPAEAVRVNVDGTLNVLEACRTHGVRRLVFGSSIAAYGERHDLMRENDPPSENIGLYGMTKRLGEMLGERYAALYGIEFVALRYCGIFGPVAVGSAGMALVRQRIKETAHGRDVAVEGASGNERVHLTHAEDAAGATLQALEHPKPSYTVYNVAGPEGNYLSLKEFHAAVRAIVPEAGNVLWSGQGRNAGPIDTRRLREDLGFTPAVSVSAGLALDLQARHAGESRHPVI